MKEKGGRRRRREKDQHLVNTHGRFLKANHESDETR
jgi:hypothetical protein